MNPKLKEKTLESLSAVLPITAIVLILSIFLVPLSIGSVVMFFVGAAMLIIGMGMFQLGSEMAMTPLGEGVGVELSKSKKIWFAIAVGFLMGILITIAEPDLQVLSNQVPNIPNIVLILTVAIGVGIFLAIAVARIIFRVKLSIILIVCYSILLVMMFFIPEEFLSVAFDSGGVTTGPITVPFIMAMGLGLAMMRSDKDAADDSFGLVALSSVGPIMAVMILGFFFKPQESGYTASEILHVDTMQDVAKAFAWEIPHYLEEVAVSIFPILLMFMLFQLFRRRYHRRQVFRVIIGFIYTYLGLVLFLCGVNVGFAPVGTLLGHELAGSTEKFLLIPIGMLIGYFIVKAEPAIQILNHQVQQVTDGAISAKAMNRSLSIGVACSVGLAMLRSLTGIPLMYMILPGYLLALVLSLIVPKIFVGIAFDSGGVASGPITTTFLLPLCIGVCDTSGGNIMTDAFGVVSLVALTPLIAIQLMGLVYKIKLSGVDTAEEIAVIPGDDDIIIFEEEAI